MIKNDIEGCISECKSIISVQLQLLTHFGTQKPIVRECSRDAIRGAGRCIAYLKGMEELRNLYKSYDRYPLDQRILNHAFKELESDTNYVPDEEDRGWYWDPKDFDPDFSYADDWWKLPKRKTSAP
jgi:hypothetical protein